MVDDEVDDVINLRFRFRIFVLRPLLGLLPWTYTYFRLLLRFQQLQTRCLNFIIPLSHLQPPGDQVILENWDQLVLAHGPIFYRYLSLLPKLITSQHRKYWLLFIFLVHTMLVCHQLFFLCVVQIEEVVPFKVLHLIYLFYPL